MVTDLIDSRFTTQTGLIERHYRMSAELFAVSREFDAQNYAGWVYEDVIDYTKTLDATRLVFTDPVGEWRHDKDDDSRTYFMESLVTVRTASDAQIGEIVAADDFGVRVPADEYECRIKQPERGKSILQALADGDELPDIVFRRGTIRGINQYKVWKRVA